MTKYKATWIEYGTGDRQWSRLCDTPEQARLAAYGKLYPPVLETIQIVEAKES